MKGIKKAVLTAFIATALVVSLGAQTRIAPASVKNDEKRFLDEQKKEMDFSSPTMEDKNVKATGLPETVVWYTAKSPIFGSKAAKTGGTFRSFLTEFPETFRTIGPNANGSFRSNIGLNLGLIDVNQDTKEWLPAAATHWAYGKDGKTMYFVLNKNQKWSDGKPVTADDYVFMIEMMRSENIQDPWYNEYYTTEITEVKKYGDYLISITSGNKMAPEDLLYNLNSSPRPKHFYPKGITATYVDDYNWNVEPTTGAYTMGEFKKGEFINLVKVKNWWGHELNQYKYCFNIDTVNYKVITGGNDVVREYFYKGELDQFYLIIPSEFANSNDKKPITDGYVDRYHSFYIPQQGMMGIFLNTKDPIFSNKSVRTGMYYAINMQKMIDTVLRGEYSRLHNIGLGHVFAGINFDDDSLRVPAFDPKKAGEFFDKAGFSTIGPDGIRVNDKGLRLSFEMIYSSPNHTERLTVLKEEAKLSGLEINLKMMQAGMFTSVREKKYQAAWFGMSTGLYDDYWEYLHSSNADIPQTNNFFGWSSPEMDKLIDAFRAEPALKKKAELTKQIQRGVNEAALIIPGYYVPYYRSAVWKWIRFPGWINVKYQNDFNDPILNGYMWIDPKIQKDTLDAMKKGQVMEMRLFRNLKYKAK